MSRPKAFRATKIFAFYGVGLMDDSSFFPFCCFSFLLSVPSCRLYDNSINLRKMRTRARGGGDGKAATAVTDPKDDKETKENGTQDAVEQQKSQQKKQPCSSSSSSDNPLRKRMRELQRQIQEKKSLLASQTDFLGGSVSTSDSCDKREEQQKPSVNKKRSLAERDNVAVTSSASTSTSASSSSSSSQPLAANWPPLLEQLDALSINETISPKSMKCSGHLESFKTQTSSSSSSSSSSSAHGSIDNTVCEKFAESQLVRQAASLSTNRIKQNNVESEERVITNHLSALKAAVSYKHSLSCTVLQNWHRILCDGLSTTAGTWRENSVHCGKVTFCAANLGNTCYPYSLSSYFINKHIV